MAKIGSPVVFKHTTVKRDPKTGEKLPTIESERYYIEIRVDGHKKRCPGYTDKGKTWSLANRLAAYLIRLAESDDRDDLITKTLTELRDKMDGKKKEPTLLEQVDDFEQSLKDKGTDPESVKTKVMRVKLFINDRGWKRPSDMRESDVLAVVAKLMTDEDKSRRTANHYMQAVKQFSRWLKRDRRAPEHFLADMTIPEVDDAELVHVRRALPMAEFLRLLDAAKNSTETLFRLKGPERMVLYIVAGYTGFRARELHTMTPVSLALLADLATATVVKTKNGKAESIPLPPHLAKLLLPWVTEKPRDKPLWPGKSWKEQGSKMLQADLATAGIPYCDEKGEFFDFHALRGQFATQLFLAGVHPAVAQRLMRHSRPELTLNIYTKLGLDNKADAVNKLPELPDRFGAEFGATPVSP